MDQLRVAWAWLVRHHFWVLVVVATLVAFGCWWSGARALYGEFVSNKQTIENEFNSMRQLRQQLFHANDEINNQQKLEIVKQQESVNARWRQLYERQRADVLKWPKNLSQDFHDRIERLKFGDTIPRNLREHYNNYINRHFPELPKIVGARETAEEGQGGYGGGRGSRGYAAEGRTTTRNYGELGPGQTPEEEEDYIVEWLDQQMVRDELYNPTTPTSKRIWKTQEDLWVYEALLGIIARTNEAAGADRFSNAAIRVIESLEVGQLAAQASRGKGRIDLVAPPAAAAAGDLYAEGGGYPAAGDAGREAHAPMGEGGYPMEGDSYFRGGTTDPTAGDALLFTGRYVNEQGMPISSTGEESADVFGKEIKRLPVRMQLWMDQRWLPQLITECANAPLQVEVQEVRINPQQGTGGYGRGGGYPGEGGRGSYSSSLGLTGDVMTPEPLPNMKTVVIQGTIYIFNPPTEDNAALAVAAGGQ